MTVSIRIEFRSGPKKIARALIHFLQSLGFRRVGNTNIWRLNDVGMNLTLDVFLVGDEKNE